MTGLQFSRSAVGTSLLATGLTWVCWQVMDDSHDCPPLGAWLAVCLVGFVLLPKRWGRRGKPGGDNAA